MSEACSSLHLASGSISDIPSITEFVEAELEKLDAPMKVVMQISIALDEILSNIFNYGYADRTGPVTLEVTEQAQPHQVCIRFIDRGIPYNPLENEDPDVTLSAQERKIGGLGIFLVKKTMDDMAYRYEDGQNILTIAKKLP